MAIKLIFPPAPGASKGFTASSSSSFTGDAASSVRELIQNALDAALVDAGKPVAKVRFVMENINLSDIPDMDEYRRVLKSGREEHKNRQSADVSDSLDNYSRKEKVSMLFVADNGVGLDARKMGAILGDGKSDKGDEDGSTGSFGNGHLTAFALSHLRYVLYGGVAQKNGETIFAGHAILASHKGIVDGKNVVRSNEGYCVRKIHPDKTSHERFDFGEKSDLPKILISGMEEIKREWQHGALIAIAAFNGFVGEKKNKIPQAIVRETARNFFAAIAEGKLEVEIYESGKLAATVNKAKLRAVLDEYKSNKRGKLGFPSGARAWNFYETMMNGEKHVLSTSLGDIELRLQSGGDIKRIAICRNNMWITDSPPQLKDRDFADRVNFSALLLVNSGTAKNAHHLLKLAETPLHNKIDVGRINSSEDKRKLRHILNEIHAQIKDRVEKRSEEFFSPPDIMQVEQSESVEGSAPRALGKIKTMENEPRPPRPESPGRSQKTEKTKTPRPRSGQSVRARVSSRKIRPGELMAVFEPSDSCDNVELRLSLDGGADITCAGESTGAIALGDIFVNDEKLPKEDKLEANGKVYAALLGKWEAGKRYNVRVGYDTPGGVGDHVLLFDLIRRKQKAAQPKQEEPHG